MGNTIIMDLAAQGDSILLSHIFDNYASSIEIDKTNASGENPLTYAICYNAEASVKILLENGANPSLLMNFGTPLEFALRNNKPISMIELLIEFGGMQNISSDEEFTKCLNMHHEFSYISKFITKNTE